MYTHRYKIANGSSNQSTPQLPSGFWALSLDLKLRPDDENVTELTYKVNEAPPYPLTIPFGASFHCNNALYCVESKFDMSRCNESFPHVIIRNLQVAKCTIM